MVGDQSLHFGMGVLGKFLPKKRSLMRAINLGGSVGVLRILLVLVIVSTASILYPRLDGVPCLLEVFRRAVEDLHLVDHVGAIGNGIG